MGGMSAFLVVLILAVVSVWLWRVRAPGGRLRPPDPLDVAVAGTIEAYKNLSHPADILDTPAFRDGVRLLQGRGLPDEKLLDYYTGDTVAMAVLALEVFGQRSGPSRELGRILEGINRVHLWPQFFALRALRARATEPVVGAALLHVEPDWLEPPRIQILRDFVRGRVADGEVPTFGGGLNGVTPEQAAFVRALLERLGEDRPQSLANEFAAWETERIDWGLLRSIGRVWDPPVPEAPSPVVEHPRLLAAVERARRHLVQESPEAVLLVGESGVGKTAAIAALATALQREGWIVFQASPADLVAGQIFVGSNEQRVRDVCAGIGGRRVLWIIPEFHALLWAGRSQQEPDRGLFDLLAPNLESGRLHVVGEIQPRAYEALCRMRPRTPALLRAVFLEPTGEEESLDIARRWLALPSAGEGPLQAGEGALREAWRLAGQYLPGHAAPGNLVSLLLQVRQDRRDSGRRTGDPVQPAEVLAALSRLAGLPVSVLDERAALDIEGLRRFFAERILGQPEAVSCLVERIAMIKAGLTDPRRPMGVFLFAGPSGTGKTEIARTLSEYLFGSAERMIRLDMSEFQGPYDLDRILGTAERTLERDALVYAIRREPFSVVLLDEIEKAHPLVLDLFLQVFDDGRLTDRNGSVADFRHSIVLMTTNLGGKLTFGGMLGFEPGEAKPGQRLQQVLEESLRREFLNRIDRVVIFQPLGPTVMRDILLREIRQLLQRRGLRSRNWAVEWEDSALDFLIERGFSPRYGARPLKRALDQHVLAPLALAIAERRAPEGDQFLYVRRGKDRLEVEFVDPEAAEPVPLERGVAEPAFAEGMSLESIALDGLGTAEEIGLLRGAHEEIGRRLSDPAWAARKEEALGKMARPEFWVSEERFAVLGAAEFLDRIEAGYRSASSLLGRIAPRDGQGQAPASMVRGLAGRLWLLRTACEGARVGTPRDAFLLVRAGRAAGSDPSPNDSFALLLGGMYRAWAEKRRMDLRVLAEQAGEDGPYRLLLAVSGFGAYEILRAEAGLHVLETPKGGHGFDRARAHVAVVPQPDQPPGPERHALRRQALETLRAGAEGRVPIVRWYRQGPAPLVRDRGRGWRTGNLDRVLGGDFDLMGACLGEARSKVT